MKKQITFILGSMSGGGAERVVSNLANFLSSNYNVNIITILDERIDYKVSEDVIITHISLKKHNPLFFIKVLRDTIKRNKTDIVISFFAKINVLVLLSLSGLRIPIFVSERNDPKKDKRGIVVKVLTYLFYPFSEGIIFQTEYAQKCFPKYIQKKSKIIPNPIDINYDLSKPKKLTGRIIAVGKLMPQKNHEILIKAFSLIEKKYPNYYIEIYGEGVLREELSKLIFKLGLEHKVFIKGRVKNVFDKIYNSDLFVLPSNYEGFSNALLEAMYLNTPVISTKIAGVNELITDSVNGRLVEINNINELSIVLENSIINYNEMVKMSLEAKSSVQGYSNETIFLKWMNFIDVD